MQAQQNTAALGENQLAWLRHNVRGFAKWSAEAARVAEERKQNPHPESLEETEKAR